MFSKNIKVIDVVLDFVQKETFGGFILFGAAFLAMIFANSSLSDEYFAFWHTPFGLAFGEHKLTMDLTHWINDGLMAIFFLMVGLEIKREIVVGELSNPKKAIFPVLAAIGGMMVPAFIYFALNSQTPSENGFAIPMATDIAFALGVLMLLGKKIPIELKIFLVTLAVVDDLGAIIIIALFYTAKINIFYIFMSVATLIILGIMNKFGIKKILPYLIVGIFLWDFTHQSGIHATIAGVLLAFIIPIKSKISSIEFVENLSGISNDFCINQTCATKNIILSQEQQNLLQKIGVAYSEVQNPLVRLEHYLHPISAFLIMPIFAFANAGVNLSGEINFAIDNLMIGIILGLLVGKPLGIFGITFLADKFQIAKKPETISWGDIFGAGLIAGIGFTMSIFISNLGLSNEESITLAKASILGSSLIAGIFGYLYFALKYRA